MRRDQRLRRGREFDTAFGQGIAQRGPLLVVRVRPNGLETTRWGFAAGKRTWKHAVDRNRVRRRLREIARSLSVEQGYDVIVVARDGALEAPHAGLVAALTALLRRSGVLREAA